MSGSPLRPDRASYGEVYADTTPVRDPKKNFAARHMNLTLWQVTGAGLIMPRVALFFLASPAKTILGRVETWNPYRETNGDYADPTITRTGMGNYLIEWPASMPDENGDAQAVSFSWAHAFVSNDDPTVLKHASAGVVAANRNQIRACVFSTTHVAEDGNNLVVYGW